MKSVCYRPPNRVRKCLCKVRTLKPQSVAVGSMFPPSRRDNFCNLVVLLSIIWIISLFNDLEPVMSEK